MIDTKIYDAFIDAFATKSEEASVDAFNNALTFLLLVLYCDLFYPMFQHNFSYGSAQNSSLEFLVLVVFVYRPCSTSKLLSSLDLHYIDSK